MPDGLVTTRSCTGELAALDETKLSDTGAATKGLATTKVTVTTVVGFSAADAVMVRCPV